MTATGLIALEPGLLQVTEAAAVAAAATMGRGERSLSEREAGEATRRLLDTLPIQGRIVIGDGGGTSSLRAEAAVGLGGGSELDLAVAPLEGATLCATGGPGAISILAAAERGGLLRAPDVAMTKIVVGPTARGSIHLDAPVAENLRGIARAFEREIGDLTVVVLDRERHTQLVADVRRVGARIRLIRDGDLSAAIAAAVRGSGVHAVFGTGGAREGVLAAAALRCLGGEIQARFAPADEDQLARLSAEGISGPDRLYRTEDLAPADDLLVTATGVTDGEFLRGVRFFGGGQRCSSLVMSLARRRIRFLDTVDLDHVGAPIYLR